MRNKINIQEAEDLLNRYYEGLTTVDEENQLSAFLQKQDLPIRFKTDRAIFGYFASRKKKSHLIIRPFIPWIGIAAAILIGLFCMKSLIIEKQTNYAYINGEKTTDVRVLKTKALSSLQAIASAPDEVQNCISNLNDNELVKEQLSLIN